MWPACLHESCRLLTLSPTRFTRVLQAFDTVPCQVYLSPAGFWHCPPPGLPESCRLLTLSPARSNTRMGWSFFSRFRAMWAPMFPSPTNPTVLAWHTQQGETNIGRWLKTGKTSLKLQYQSAIQWASLACSTESSPTEWSLYFTTIYFKTTFKLGIRPLNLVPKCNFVYLWTLILRLPAVLEDIFMVPWVVLKQREHYLYTQ